MALYYLFHKLEQKFVQKFTDMGGAVQELTETSNEALVLNQQELFNAGAALATTFTHYTVVAAIGSASEPSSGALDEGAAAAPVTPPAGGDRPVVPVNPIVEGDDQ